MPLTFERNKSYSFNSYYRPNQRAVGWKVTSLIDFQTANRLGYDVSTTHARVIGSIPGTAVSRDATKLTYILFNTPSNVEECVALEWIIQDSIEEFSNAEVHAVVRGTNVSVTDVARIQDILSQNGYRDFTVTLASS